MAEGEKRDRDKSRRNILKRSRKSFDLATQNAITANAKSLNNEETDEPSRKRVLCLLRVCFFYFYYYNHHN